MDSGAAMVHREGDSLPFLIPRGSSQEEALRIALDIDPAERLLDSALIPAVKACVSYNCLNQFRVKRHRHGVAESLEFLSEILRSAQIQLTNSLPVLGPARKLHIPLIRRLVRQLDYTDESLETDSVRCIPPIGVFPRTSRLPAEGGAAAVNLPDVRGQYGQRTRMC